MIGCISLACRMHIKWLTKTMAKTVYPMVSSGVLNDCGACLQVGWYTWYSLSTACADASTIPGGFLRSTYFL